MRKRLRCLLLAHAQEIKTVNLIATSMVVDLTIDVATEMTATGNGKGLESGSEKPSGKGTDFVTETGAGDMMIDDMMIVIVNGIVVSTGQGRGKVAITKMIHVAEAGMTDGENLNISWPCGDM